MFSINADFQSDGGHLTALDYLKEAKEFDRFSHYFRGGSMILQLEAQDIILNNPIKDDFKNTFE